jgi:hypothetical protein
MLDLLRQLAFARQRDVAELVVQVRLELIHLRRRGGGAGVAGFVPDQPLRPRVELIQVQLHAVAEDDAVVVLVKHLLQRAAVAREHDHGEGADRDDDQQQPAETEQKFVPKAVHIFGDVTRVARALIAFLLVAFASLRRESPPGGFNRTYFSCPFRIGSSSQTS